MTMPRLQVIGGGKMGEALIAGLLAGGWASTSELRVVERLADRAAELRDRFPGLDVGNEPGVAQGHVVAVKPGDVEAACRALVAASADAGLVAADPMATATSGGAPGDAAPGAGEAAAGHGAAGPDAGGAASLGDAAPGGGGAASLGGAAAGGGGAASLGGAAPIVGGAALLGDAAAGGGDAASSGGGAAPGVADVAGPGAAGPGVGGAAGGAAPGAGGAASLGDAAPGVGRAASPGDAARRGGGAASLGGAAPGGGGAGSSAGLAPVLSIAAGVTISRLEAVLAPGTPVVRAMPNTPALVGAGAAAVAGGSAAGAAELDWASSILGAVGTVVVVDESLLDAVTGLSGSGPAYVFLVVEALVDGGVLAGLPRGVASALAAQTVLGAAQLLASSSDGPEALRAAVTSPGGTTAVGLRALERGGVRAAFLDAVMAATERSRELGRSG